MSNQYNFETNDDPFEITGIKLVGSYIFNLPKNEECTICRNSLHAPSIYKQEEGLDSYVVSGVCQHSYHNECIKSWVEKNKYCPICFEKWEPVVNKKILDQDGDSLPLLISTNQINKDLKLVSSELSNDKEKIFDNINKTINIINKNTKDKKSIIENANIIINNLDMKSYLSDYDDDKKTYLQDSDIDEKEKEIIINYKSCKNKKSFKKKDEI
jgi:hypothetical protein